ncbi:MAG: hypothetical protein ACPH56_03420 [Spongiibacter marinus]|uniref:hypothetical protein n=1 Tax=Spongiibacter marinus TaxID=354246 RepID=UPI003C5BCE2A
MRKAGIGLCVLLLLASCGGGNTSNATRTAAPFELGPEAPFTERVDHHADLPSCVLLAGTMGIPDPVSLDVLPDIGSGLLGAVSPEVPEGFPERVHLRSDTATFNRKYQFYLHEGRVWYKKNAAVEEAGPWLAVPMPACLAGTLIGISADDDELIAIRENGDIYGLDNILKDPLLFNWTSRWGAPIWLGTGYYIQEDYLSWSWTVISNSEDKNWRDPAGNLHRVGDGKVSHIWMLRDNGQRYTFIDPWLPKDESYEACGPLRGRFKGVNLNSSGSTLVTVNRYGDIYTRHYDFDLAGDNEVFFQYAFEDQRGVANPKIQLPSFPWVQQPKVPGEITHLISIHKLGINMAQRLIRVEGRDAKGNVGYWEKAVAAESVADWQFYQTGGHLRGTLLDNSPKDTSQRDLGESEDRYYQRNMASVATLAPERDLRDDMDWAAELSDFNLYCSPTTLRVYTGPEESMDLTLHVVDVIRQTPRARGLDDEPRSFRGNIEVPEALSNQKAALSTRQRQFLTLYLEDKAFTDVRMSGVPSRITITKSALSGGFEWQFEQP